MVLANAYLEEEENVRIETNVPKENLQVSNLGEATSNSKTGFRKTSKLLDLEEDHRIANFVADFEVETQNLDLWSCLEIQDGKNLRLS